MNDVTLRRFMENRISSADPTNSMRCHASSGSRYTARSNTDIVWHAVCINPTICGSVRGIQILHQIAPQRLSRVFAKLNASGLHLKTENVHQLSIDLSKQKHFLSGLKNMNLWVIDYCMLH